MNGKDWKILGAWWISVLITLAILLAVFRLKYYLTGDDSLSAFGLSIMAGAAVLLIVVVAGIASWLKNRK